MKAKSSNILYFIMLFCACGSYMLAHSTIPNSYGSTIVIIHLFDYFSYFLGICIIVSERYPLKKLILCTCVGILILFSALFSKDIILLKGFIIILASLNIDTKTIIKNYLCIILFFTVCFAILSLTNRIEDIIEIRTISGNLRHSLGFSHPNRLGYVLFLVSLSNLYLHYQKYNILDVFFNGALVSFAILITNSKSVAIIICGIAILELYLIFFKAIPVSALKFTCKITLICAPLISLYMSLIYNEKNFYHMLLNELFTGRLYLAHNAYLKYGFSILGQKINSVMALEAVRSGNQILAIDNFYVYVAIHFGYVILILIMLSVFGVFKKVIKNSKSEIFLFWIFFISIYGLFENQIIDLRINFPMLILYNIGLKKFMSYYRDSCSFTISNKRKLQLQNYKLRIYR